MGEAVESFGQVSEKSAKVSFVINGRFAFSNIADRQCWALNPFLKPHWNFDKIGSKYSDIRLNINLSYILEIFDNILAGLSGVPGEEGGLRGWWGWGVLMLSTLFCPLFHFEIIALLKVFCNFTKFLYNFIQ